MQYNKDTLLMCPECGVVLTAKVWERHKSTSNTFVYCERCGTKNHWENLRVIQD